MKQEQIKTSAEQEQQTEDLQSQFEKVKSIKYRWVMLKFRSCCGCGCEDINIYRKVPEDSPLKNGNRAEDYLNNDISENEYNRRKNWDELD